MAFRCARGHIARFDNGPTCSRAEVPLAKGSGRPGRQDVGAAELLDRHRAERRLVHEETPVPAHGLGRSMRTLQAGRATPTHEGYPVVSGGRRGASVHGMKSHSAHAARAGDPRRLGGRGHRSVRGRRRGPRVHVRVLARRRRPADADHRLRAPGGLASHDGVEPGWIVLSVQGGRDRGRDRRAGLHPARSGGGPAGRPRDGAGVGLHGQAGRAAVAAPAGLRRVADLGAQLGHGPPLGRARWRSSRPACSASQASSGSATAGSPESRPWALRRRSSPPRPRRCSCCPRTSR